MPIANSNGAGGLPVVNKGEDLQAWLNRAVPALMDRGIPENQAVQFAQEAWNKVNGNGMFAGSQQPQQQPQGQQQPQQGQQPQRPAQQERQRPEGQQRPQERQPKRPEGQQRPQERQQERQPQRDQGRPKPDSQDRQQPRQQSQRPDGQQRERDGKPQPRQQQPQQRPQQNQERQPQRPAQQPQRDQGRQQPEGQQRQQQPQQWGQQAQQPQQQTQQPQGQMDWDSSTWGSVADLENQAQDWQNGAGMQQQQSADDWQQADADDWQQQMSGGAGGGGGAPDWQGDPNDFEYTNYDNFAGSGYETNIGEWYANRLVEFAQALGNHLLNNGIVQSEEFGHMLSVVQDMAGAMSETLSQRLATPQETNFSFNVSLPDPGRFVKGGPGSGNFGHMGLPGVWGGSRSRGGGGRSGGSSGRKPRGEQTGSDTREKWQGRLRKRGETAPAKPASGNNPDMVAAWDNGDYDNGTFVRHEDDGKWYLHIETDDGYETEGPFNSPSMDDPAEGADPTWAEMAKEKKGKPERKKPRTVADIPDDYELITDSRGIKETLDDIGYEGDPSDYGALFVKVGEGDYLGVYGIESAIPELHLGVDDLLAEADASWNAIGSEASAKPSGENDTDTVVAWDNGQYDSGVFYRREDGKWDLHIETDDGFETDGPFNSPDMDDKAEGYKFGSGAMDEAAEYASPHFGRHGQRGGSMSREEGYAQKMPELREKWDKNDYPLFKRLLKDQGFSYQPVDDSSPASGYVLSPYGDREKVVPVGRLNPDTLEQFLNDNADMWNKPNHYFGAWYNTEDDKVYLDVSIVVDTPEKATQLSIQHKQEAYYDIAAGETVYTRARDDYEDQKAASAALWASTKAVSGPYVTKFPRKGSPLPEQLAIKSLGRNRVGNYLVVWGDPAHRDLSGEFFTPNTQELTAIFDAIGTLPAIYHHALDNTVKSAVVGLVERMEKDDVGLWIEAQVREHDAYKKFIKPLVDGALLGWSSGALPGGRQVNKSTGEILRWPIVEASMTPTPMEWRMAAQWPVQNIKAVYQRAGLPFNVVSDALRPKPPKRNRQAEEAARELELIRLLELS